MFLALHGTQLLNLEIAFISVKCHLLPHDALNINLL